MSILVILTIVAVAGLAAAIAGWGALRASRKIPLIKVREIRLEDMSKK